MSKSDFPLKDVYGLLETGPVILISTSWKKRESIMAQSWHTMIEFEPPIVACVISSLNYSHELLDKSGECAINIPTLEIGEKAAACGNASGREIDKFEAFSLTRGQAEKLSAPLVMECYANLECKVVDRMRKYELFFIEVVKAHVDISVHDPKTLHHRGYGDFMVAGETLRLKSEMR
jgi:flavin reductase (DIM6/NTAB) family NADH-FMN oxidoreductase RutF